MYAGRGEKAMAPHSSTLAWKNLMDGGAWWAAVHALMAQLVKNLPAMQETQV